MDFSVQLNVSLSERLSSCLSQKVKSPTVCEWQHTTPPCSRPRLLSSLLDNSSPISLLASCGPPGSPIRQRVWSVAGTSHGNVRTAPVVADVQKRLATALANVIPHYDWSAINSYGLLHDTARAQDMTWESYTARI